MYVAIVGTKGKEQVTVRETTRVPGSTKKVTKIVKNYGYLADLIKDNPNFVEDLKKEIQEERERKKVRKKCYHHSSRQTYLRYHRSKHVSAFRTYDSKPYMGDNASGQIL